MRVLLVAEECELGSPLERGLREVGYAVEPVADPGSALDLLVDGPPYDLAVFDAGPPARPGLGLVKTVRERDIHVPVLLVTGDSVTDRVAGLDLGADDCLARPFVLEEFLARVRALMRRGTLATPPVLRLADLVLDPATRQARRGERSIRLTTREFALLEYFMRNTGRVLTRPMILDHVWGLGFDPESNVIDVYVGYLRRKIDASGELPLIHTVRGAGYVLARREPHAAGAPAVAGAAA